MEEQKCPICEKEGQEIESLYPSENKDILRIRCEICGLYRITGHALKLNYLSYLEDRRYILSGVSRETNRNGREIEITTKNIQQLIDSASLPDSPLEAIDRILLYIYENVKDTASFVELKHTDYPIAYAKDKEEFKYLLEKAKNELKYLKPEIDWRRYGKTTFEKTNKIPRYKLTPKGRARVKELQWKQRE